MKYEKQRIDSAALHRISCSCVGSLSSVALFCCIFSVGTFFGIIRVYTVVFSDPKPFVMGRKNWLFSDTNKGADASMMWYSVIESTKLNNLNVYGYLLHLLTELPKLGEKPAPEQLDRFMPWAKLPDFCI